jgi:hypothetical protein
MPKSTSKKEMAQEMKEQSSMLQKASPYVEKIKAL